MTLFVHTGSAAVCREHRAGTGPAGLPGHCQQLQEGGGRIATARGNEGEAWHYEPQCQNSTANNKLLLVLSLIKSLLVWP